MADQTTFNHLTLIGPLDARVLVATDAPQALLALSSPGTPYDEEMVWRSAETGSELARSEALPPMTGGSPISPGFASTVYYVGSGGEIVELTTAWDSFLLASDPDSDCQAPSP
ncbi:MAG: hypothetical protein AAFU77_00250 [Myxococcota bacterium]